MHEASSSSVDGRRCRCCLPFRPALRNFLTSSWTAGDKKLPWMVETPCGGCAGITSIPSTRPFGRVRSTATFRQRLLPHALFPTQNGMGRSPYSPETTSPAQTPEERISKTPRVHGCAWDSTCQIHHRLARSEDFMFFVDLDDGAGERALNAWCSLLMNELPTACTRRGTSSLRLSLE